MNKRNDDRPNVIIIITDDQGFATVGLHGDPHVRTPNMDRLANEGAECVRFYGNPLCSPTRASLMTGRYAYRTGILHTSRGGALMSADEVTAAELFSRAGYRTGIYGKWHLGDNYPMRPIDCGFQEAVWHKSGGIGQTPDKPNSYFDPLLYRQNEPFQAKGYCTDVFFDEALSFIDRNWQQPFFIYLATNAPHDPLEVEDRYTAPYKQKGLSEEVARVYGMVENIDDNIGRLLTHLDSLGLDNETIIFFLSDHGPAPGRFNAGFRSHKGNVYEGGIRVPFFIRWPQHIEAGVKIDQIAAHIDILPTLLDLCQIEITGQLKLDGTSLRPLVGDPKSGWSERTLFIQTHRGSFPRQYHNAAAISGQYKWLSYPGRGEEWAIDTSTPEMELYQIDKDPGEQTNLAEKRPDIVQHMRQLYDDWFKDVTDGWRVGTIHIGNDAENPTALCRYQDSEYNSIFPLGWRVRIEQAGDYKIKIKRGTLDGPGVLKVDWQEKIEQAMLKEGQEEAIFSLSVGEGRLGVWLELNEIGRVTFSSNETIGDVEILRL